MTRRLEIIKKLMPNVRKVVFDYFNQSRISTADKREGHELAEALGYIESDIGDIESDTDAIEFERFRLRPFTLKVHQILQREHATLAKPVLGWSKISIDPNAVAFCGASNTRELLLKVCSERHLRLIDVIGEQSTAVDRWDRLRSARIVVFDLSVHNRVLRASVFHELGLSIALGQYPVVLIFEGDQVPFDVDIKPVVVGPTASDFKNICIAMDAALFSFPRLSGRSSFEATLERLDHQIAFPTPEEKVLLKQLRTVSESRVEALSLIYQMLIARKHDGLALFFPRWPGDYTDDNGLRCFHITPFAEEFALARNTVKKNCSKAEVKYQKGDQGPLLDILHSIWLLTCRANGVIADLTGLNDNVCVEVGMAFALGRPILLTAQKCQNTTPELYPDIEKMQLHLYQTMDELGQLVSNFISNIVR